MTKKELGKYFDKKQKETHNEDNIFAPPISGQECFDVLSEHFLGPDWYSVNPIHRDQINAEKLIEIILRYPGYNEKPHRRIKRFFKKVMKIILNFENIEV